MPIAVEGFLLPDSTDGAGVYEYTSSKLSGVTPKAIWIIGAPAAGSYDTLATHMNAANGFSDGVNEAGVYLLSTDGTASSSTGRADSNDSLGLFAGLEGTAIGDGGEGNPGMIPGGVRINWTTVTTTSNRRAMIVFFHGDDVEAAVGVHTPNSSNGGTATTSGLGFDPDLIMFLADGKTIADGMTSNFPHGINSVGFCDADLNQSCFAMWNETSQAAGSPRLRRYDNRVGGQLTTWTGEVTALPSGGFTTTTRDGGSGGDGLAYMAISFGGVEQVEVLSFDSPTTAASDWTVSTSFEPDAAIVLSCMAQAVDSLEADADAGAHGFHIHDGTDGFGIAFAEEFDADPTNVAGIATDQFIFAMNDDQSTAFDIGGPTFNASDFTVPAASMTTADGTARKWFGFVVGTVGGGTTYDQATSQGAPTLGHGGVGVADVAGTLGGGAPALAAATSALTNLATALNGGAASLGFALADDLVVAGGVTYDQATDHDAPVPTFTLAATLAPFAWIAADNADGTWTDADPDSGTWTDADPETATWTDD
ncbi:MAG: hypothetical protein RIM84_26115 [Alphaproteobacteria bacterium]